MPVYKEKREGSLGPSLVCTLNELQLQGYYEPDYWPEFAVLAAVVEAAFGMLR
jgi:hypothetical protein